MGMGANLLLTQIAWTAGHKAMNFLPEKWKNKFSGSRSDDELLDFIIRSKGNPEPINLIQEGISYISFQTGNVENKPIIKEPQNGNQNWFYTIGDNFHSTDGYVCMYLRVQGTDTIMEIPCVDGSPRISMQVVQNEMPTASSQVATTNRRIKPIVFKFSFPIAYLRVYGENDEDDKIKDIEKNALKKKVDKLKEKWDDINPIGFLSDKNKYDFLNDPKDKVKNRTIPSYSQVLSKLIQFPRQFGCYLYMGFGFSGIGVTCSIDITSQKGDMDCIWVDMTLVETMEFDFNELKYVNGGFDNVLSTRAKQNTSNGSVVANNTSAVSA